MQSLVPLFTQMGESLLEAARILKQESERATLEWRLLNQYGEIVTKKDARAILGIGHEKVTQMLKDGRLDPACEGQMISVRSIARYMQNPKQQDWNAKMLARQKALKPVRRQKAAAK